MKIFKWIRVRRRVVVRKKNISKAEKEKSRVEYLEYKEIARKIVLEKLQNLQKVYKENFGVEFFWNRVSIKNTSSRWGSCSSKKNLSFNYKIVFLDDEAQDYLVAHELCHLKEMNHSPRFWAVVKSICPDYLNVRKQLKALSPKLHVL